MINWKKYLNEKDIKKAIISLRRIKKFKKEPIIIGGSARSGTSLISAILDANEEIKSLPRETYTFVGERKFTTPKLNKYRNLFYLNLFLVRENIKPTKVRWCEKTPRNVHFLNYIIDEFEGHVKIILMIRDGRDVITSSHPRKDKRYYVSIERWIKDTEETFKYINHENVFILPYESLVNKFDLSMQKLMKFLESPYDQKTKEYHKFSSIKKHTAFHGKNLKGIFNKSVERWKLKEHKERIEEFLKFSKAVELQNLIQDYTIKFNKSIEKK